jgi:gliding motility-associated-like protein
MQANVLPQSLIWELRSTTDDNCGVDEVTNDAPATFPVQAVLPTTPVTWTVTDMQLTETHGNSATAEQIVTVSDDQNPSITAPAAINTTADAGECFATIADLGTPATDDNCGVDEVTNDAPATFPVGATTVTWTVTDIHGNSATATQMITITDNEDPTISAPANLTVSADADDCHASGVTLGTPVTSDNCSVASVTNNAPAAFPLGSTTVIWTVTDANGNTAAASQTVTVIDNTAPVIVCKDLAIYLRPNGEYVLSQDNINTIAGTITDNCSNTQNISVSVSPDRFSCEQAGQKVPVLVTATDAYGNTSTCEAIVTVIDNVYPVVTCPDDITVSATEGKCTAVVNFAAEATDNCEATITYSHEPGSEFPVGITSVTVTATDPSGNSDVCSFNIIVTDNESPVITCPENIMVSSAEGECGAMVEFEAVVTDNCSANPTVTYSHESGSIFPVGITQVIVTAADAAGNSSECSFNITVTDDETPAIICPEDVTVSIDEGICGALVQYEVQTADNCGQELSVTYSHESGTVFPVGITTVLVTVTDAAGNSADCAFNVTVTDDEMPFVVCAEDMEVITDAGECETSVIVPAPVEMGDNCGFTIINDYNNTEDASGIYPVGTTMVTWTITDNAGNSATCSVNITVKAAPVAKNDAASTPENTPIVIDVLANDTDCSNSINPATTIIVTEPVNGTVSIDEETGMATYVPAPGFYGADEFTYSVCNAGGLCDEAIVSVTVLSVNKAPYALDDINITFINTPISGWVITNDTDPNDDELAVNTTLVSGTEHGTVVLNANGSYLYTPNQGFTGKDHFEYQICDGNGLCDEAMVTITVIQKRIEGKNRPPVAVEDNYFGKTDVPVFGNLLSNDFDSDGDNLIISVTPVTSPSTGTLEINADGTFSYFPENGFTGLVFFEYEICDDASPALCSHAMATIDIRENNNANTTVAVDDAYYMIEGDALNADVSANDYDPESDNQINFALLVAPSNGTMALFPNGTFEYIPFAGYTGNDFFIYEVCDNGEPMACDRATAYISVEAAPVDTVPGPPQEQEVFMIPEGFSPNGDNINDYFVIPGIQPYPNARIEIYNRWGTLLYAQEDYGNTDRWGSTDAWWDGSSNKKWTSGSEKLPPGTYFYILNLNDGREPITGAVFLNRNR